MAATVEVLINGKNNLSRAVADAQRDLQGLERAAGGIGRTLATAGKIGLGALAVGGAALGGVIVGATKGAAQYEQQMANVQAVLNANTADAERLNKAALDLALDPKLKVSIAEVGASFEMLAKNGMTTEQILGGVAKSTVLLANASGGDFALAADTLTSSMLMFNRSAGDTEQMVNSMAGVMNASKFDAQDYSYAVANAGGAANAANMSFENMNEFIAAISPNFKSGREAGTSLGLMLQGLVPRTKGQIEAFRELGLIAEDGTNAFFGLNGELRTNDEIFQILKTTFGGMSAERALTIIPEAFNQQAMDAILALSGMTEKQWELVQATIAGTNAMDAATTRTSTLQGAWEVLGDTMGAMGIAIGNQWREPLRQFVVELGNTAATLAPMIAGLTAPLATAISSTLTTATTKLQKFQTDLKAGKFEFDTQLIDFSFDWSNVDAPETKLNIAGWLDFSKVGEEFSLALGTGFKIDWDAVTGELSISAGNSDFNKVGEIIWGDIADAIQFSAQGKEFVISAANWSISNLEGVVKIAIGKAFSASVEGGKLTITMGDGGITLDWGGLSQAMQQSFAEMRTEIITAYQTNGLSGVAGVAAGWAVGVKDTIWAELRAGFSGAGAGGAATGGANAPQGYITAWLVAQKQAVTDAFQSAFVQSVDLPYALEGFQGGISEGGTVGQWLNQQKQNVLDAIQQAFTVENAVGVAVNVAGWAVGMKDAIVQEFERAFVGGGETGGDPTPPPGSGGGYVTEWVTAQKQNVLDAINTAFGTSLGEDGGTTFAVNAQTFNTALGIVTGAMGTLGTLRTEALTVAMNAVTDGIAGIAEAAAKFTVGVDAGKVAGFLTTVLDGITAGLDVTLDDARMASLGTAAGKIVGALATKLGEVVSGDLGKDTGEALSGAVSGLAGAATALVTAFGDEIAKTDWDVISGQVATFVSGFVGAFMNGLIEAFTQWRADFAAEQQALIDQGPVGVAKAIARDTGVQWLLDRMDQAVKSNVEYQDQTLAEARAAGIGASEPLVKLTGSLDSLGTTASTISPMVDATVESMAGAGAVLEYGALTQPQSVPTWIDTLLRALQLGPMPKEIATQGIGFGMPIFAQPTEPVAVPAVYDFSGVDATMGALLAGKEPLPVPVLPTLAPGVSLVSLTGETGQPAKVPVIPDWSAAVGIPMEPVEIPATIIQATAAPGLTMDLPLVNLTGMTDMPAPVAPVANDPIAVDTSGLEGIVSAMAGFTWPQLPPFTWPSYPAFRWPSIERPGWLNDMKVPRPSWIGELLSWSPTVTVRGGGGGGSSSDAITDGTPLNALGAGWFGGGLTWVGETGPELVSLPRGSSIYSNAESERMGGAVNVIVNATVASALDVEALAYRVSDLIQRRRR